MSGPYINLNNVAQPETLEPRDIDAVSETRIHDPIVVHSPDFTGQYGKPTRYTLRAFRVSIALS